MMTLKERAHLAEKQLYRDHFLKYSSRRAVLSITDVVDIIESHLRDAVEEAVKAKLDSMTSAELYSLSIKKAEENAKVGQAFGVGVATPLPLRPKVEDALKAVAILCNNLMGLPVEGAIECLAVGCVDLITGHRDTAAARSITGEPKKGGS